MLRIEIDHERITTDIHGRAEVLVTTCAACDTCGEQLGETRYGDTEWDRGSAHASAVTAGARAYIHRGVLRLACDACAPLASGAAA